MLQKTISLVRQNWRYYLLFCVLDVALATFSVVAISKWSFALSISLAITTSVLWLVLAFFVLSASIFQGRSTPGGPCRRRSSRTFLPFALKGLALNLIILAICAPIFFVVAAQAPFAYFQESGPLEPVSLFALVFFVGTAIISSSVLALLGTWLPATVCGINPLFSQAMKRGIYTFWPSFFRINAILILYPLISWGVTTVAFASAPPFTIGLSGPLTIVTVIVAALNYTVNAIFVTLMMVALSKNYFEGEGLLQVEPEAILQQ